MNGKLLGQGLVATALVLGFLAYSVDNLIWAIQQHNTPELIFAGAGTLLLLWLLYKFMKAWARWRTWPSAAELKSIRHARRRSRITGQRVFIVWFMAVVSTAYAALSWVAYPKWPMSQHLLRVLLAVVFLALAVLLTLIRRRQLSVANGAHR